MKEHEYLIDLAEPHLSKSTISEPKQVNFTRLVIVSGMPTSSGMFRNGTLPTEKRIADFDYVS